MVLTLPVHDSVYTTVTKVYTKCDASHPPTVRQKLTSVSALWSTALWLVVTDITWNAWKFQALFENASLHRLSVTYINCITCSTCTITCQLHFAPDHNYCPANPIDRWVITRCLREGSAIQESPTLVEQLQALNSQFGNQYFNSPLHCNWAIHVM